MKTFAAKFPGHCRRCRQDIRLGQMIHGRTSDPWVHDGCTSAVTDADKQRIDRWHDAIKRAGFVREDDEPLGDSWVRDRCVTWTMLNEHYVHEFHVAYDEDEDTVKPEFSFTTYDPEAVVIIADALHKHDGVPVDDFEAYRQKLIEKMS